MGQKHRYPFLTLNISYFESSKVLLAFSLGCSFSKGYRLRGPLITFCQFFSSQLNPRFSQDHERDRFLIWGPTHHLMPFFTNISVLPTHYFIWGPTHHFLTFVTYISVLPTHYFIWGPTHHFLTF